MVDRPKTNLLINESPLVLLPTLAQILGLRGAVVTQQVHYWLDLFEKARDKAHFHEGRWWVWNSAEAWHTNFPFWTPAVIRSILDLLRQPYEPRDRKRGKAIAQDRRLRRKAVLLTATFNKKPYDRTLWWTIDYAELSRLEFVFRKSLEVEEELPLTENPLSLVNLPDAVPPERLDDLRAAEDHLDLAAAIEEAGLTAWTDPRDVSAWEGAPVDAFWLHIGQSDEPVPDSKRESWGKELQRIAGLWSEDTAIITPEIMSAALTDWPRRYPSRWALSSPYSKGHDDEQGFSADIGSLLLRAHRISTGQEPDEDRTIVVGE